MTVVWAALAGARWLSLAAVGVVGLGVVVWQARVWVRRRQVEHAAWIRLVLADDREVAELETALRRVARQHEQNS